MNNATITLESRKRIEYTQGDLKGQVRYLDKYSVATPSDILKIPTTQLAVGSDIIVSNSTMDYHRWNGTTWEKAE